MDATTKPPARLFKYRRFSDLTLEMLVADVMYFADPSTFNDPLDTKPALSADLDVADLEQTLSRMFEQRVSSELTAAAKQIKYQGPKTLEHIAQLSRRRTERLLTDIRYNAGNPVYEGANPEKFLLGQYVQEELLRRYDKGVVSLAERPDCPLMWSHYGDQHRGVCLGYSVPAKSSATLHKMRYGGNRLVKASSIAAMINGDESAREEVDGAVLLRKAQAWRYEREWRLIGPRGTQDSPLELEEVVFGMRCSEPVKYAVVKALEDRSRAVKFYEIREQRGRFLLDKRVLDTGELCASYPYRYQSIHDAFADLEGLDAEAGPKRK